MGRLAPLHTPGNPVTAARLAEAGNPHDVRIEYTALDLSTPERVRFRFDLAGPV